MNVTHDLRRACLGVLVGSLVGCLGCASLVKGTGRVLEHQLELEGLEHETALVDRARVEAWVGESGSPLLLLHGFGPAAPWQWSAQIDAFAAEHRLVVPNLLWFGRSIDPDREFGLDRQVEVVAGLLDELDIDRIDVVGVSYGGMVAYRLAASRPDLVRRLVLVDTPGALFRKDAYVELLQRHDVRSATELFLPETAADVERLLHLAFWDPPSVPRSVRAAASDVLYDANRNEKAALLQATLEDLADGFDGPVPDQPSLVVWGRHDTVFPLWVGEELAELLDAPLVILDEARHAPNVERPDVFNPLVLDWLESSSTRPKDPTPDESEGQRAAAEQ